MWIFQEWGGKVLEEIFHFKSQKSPHPPVPLLSTLHGWYRNNPPLCSDGLGTEPWFLPAFSNPTCFCHFSLTLVLIFFPGTNTFPEILPLYFISVKIIEILPRTSEFFPILHLLPQPVPQVCQSSHSKTRSLQWFVSHLSLFYHHIPNAKLFCFLLTQSRLFYWIGGHWHDGLFIAAEKIFLLSSRLFCLLHILLNLHFVFDKSRNKSEIVLLGTGMPTAYILLFIIFLPLYFYLSTELLEWRKRMLKGAD